MKSCWLSYCYIKQLWQWMRHSDNKKDQEQTVLLATLLTAIWLGIVRRQRFLRHVKYIWLVTLFLPVNATEYWSMTLFHENFCEPSHVIWITKYSQSSQVLCISSNCIWWKRCQARTMQRTENKISIVRSSHQEVFLGRGVLKICSKFTREHPYGSVNHISAWAFSCK